MEKNLNDDVKDIKKIYVNKNLQKISVDKNFKIIATDLIYKFPVNSKTNQEILTMNNFKLYQSN